MRKSLHRARAAGRGRHFGFLGAFAAVHFGLVVHAAIHGTILHSAILHGAILHPVGASLVGGSHGAILHGTAGATTLHGPARSTALHGASGRRSLGKSRGAQTKCAGRSNENLGGLHDNTN